MNIIKKSYLDVQTIVFTAYLLLSIYRFAFPSLGITLLMIAVGLLSIILIYKVKFNVYIYLFSFFILFYYILTSFILNRYDALPRNILHFIDCIFIALLMLNGKIKSWGVYLVFYGLSFYFLTFIIMAIPVQNVLDYSSWNGISILIIISCVSLYIVNSYQSNKIDLVPAFLALLFSFWGMGRSGILACSLLFIGLLFLKFKNPKRLFNLNNSIFMITLIIISLLFFYLSDYFKDIVINTLKIINRDTADISTGRFEIWENYYSNLDLLRFLFGSNVYADPWPKGEELGYNLHNSFLRLFAHTGLMGLLTILLIPVTLLYFFYKNKLFFILFFTLILRGFTDTIFFFESWDFLLLFFLFYYLNSIRTNKLKFPSKFDLDNKLRL